MAKFAPTAADGKIYQVDYYNLDMIISLGYRINSERDIEFRRWATETLKEHLVQGYTINQKRLAITGINEIEQRVKLLSRTLLKSADANDIGVAAISIITNYATTWRLLLPRLMM